MIRESQENPCCWDDDDDDDSTNQILYIKNNYLSVRSKYASNIDGLKMACPMKINNLLENVEKI